MPLLQGQPFTLIKSLDSYPNRPNAEIYTIQHTGEEFFSKSDYEDRLALYSQNIWTCQCTGRTGLTHLEAWTNEAKVRHSAMNAVPLVLQKPLLSLVHHSLSPLEQLIDAAYILCYSQYHVGEELIYLGGNNEQYTVHIVNAKDGSKLSMAAVDYDSPNSVVNGVVVGDNPSLPNGALNGLLKPDSPGTSPGKENQTKDSMVTKEDEFKRDMLPKLYDVLVLENNSLLENVSYKCLQRPYKIPSKDQIRLFIRSCALRHRGTTCTPWVVSEELIKKFNIQNKLPTVFLSSPKPRLNVAPTKRKAHSPSMESIKRAHSENTTETRWKPDEKVAPLIIKTGNIKKSFFNVVKTQNYKDESSVKLPVSELPKEQPHKTPKYAPPFYKLITKHPLSMGKPKILAKTSNYVLPKSSSAPSTVRRKRGRPPLSQEEKERNKKLREATLFDISKKVANQCVGKLLKIRTVSFPTTPLPLQNCGPFFSSIYKSPVKRATTPEAIMKLPFMRKYAYEHRTIKGVIGQFRRLAHTMDIVLAKLSAEQIEMIPDEVMKQDLWTRQKKVRDKKFIQNLTPEERKQYIRDKARMTALERWKERKLKNLKIEDKTLKDLKPLPQPALVETPKPFQNSLFSDVVMVTEFIQCFQELLLGEEKLSITSDHLMQALISGSKGFQIVADVLCYLLPTIIRDDICKHCKEIGVPISSIPITYQTAPELVRLCLRNLDDEDATDSPFLDENEQIGREKSELPEELLNKLQTYEFWDLNHLEIMMIMKALVHKTLSTASLSVYVEEVEEKNLQVLRERRKFLKEIQKEKESEVMRKKEEKRLNKEAQKGNQPKKQRGRPKGYSPKIDFQNYFKKPKEVEVNPIEVTVMKRRKSMEELRKEKAERRRLEKERAKQQEEDHKKEAMEKKYEDVVVKKENILRRTPIGYDRDHKRYWIFHTSSPGLYVEKGWVHHSTNYRFSSVKKSETSDDEDEKPLAKVLAKSKKSEDEDDNKPLSVFKSDLKCEQDEDDKPLATIKSKLSISPMKMSCRGRPPKEAYILVDEDTQTFPEIGENVWYKYSSMAEVETLLESLTDQGHRESQLRAAIGLNLDRLRLMYDVKSEHLTVSTSTSENVKESLKEDIAQIERELIEGWLGGVPDFATWEKEVLEAGNLAALGPLLIEAQKHIHLKNLKGLMAPDKMHLPPTEGSDVLPEMEDSEGLGVEKWREAVLSCKTYSRLHVLVGLFDSCIKWEKSMATRKCRICRSKKKDDPLLFCDKCENSYHWYCMRPPLKEEPGEHWLCPPCMPKKIRREESGSEMAGSTVDPDEREDPTFVLSKQGRSSRSKRALMLKKAEKECIVCYGRIGLIVCSKCNSAYHSECHDPPLLIRARKDWVCGRCVRPRSKARILENDSIANELPTNQSPKEDKTRTMPPRGRMGRFIRKGDTLGESHQEEEVAPTDRFGRFIRGAKTKALENMTAEGHEEGSRRSSRNKDARKRYNYDSEASSEEEMVSESEEESEDDISEREEVRNESEEPDGDDFNSEDCEGSYVKEDDGIVEELSDTEDGVSVTSLSSQGDQ